MKIAIDISQIVHGTGVSFYTRNLVTALAKIDRKNEYLLFGSSLRLKDKLEDFAKEIEKKNPNFKAKIFPLPPTLTEPLWNRFRFISLENLVGSFDLLHSSDWTQPPTKAKKITTIHDFGFVKFPEVAHPKIKSVMLRRLGLVKKECDQIIAVSLATKKDIEAIMGIRPDKISVVYEAAPEQFCRVSAEKINQVREKLNLKGDYLLAVGTREPRKNLSRIIQAFLKVRQKIPLTLVLVGKLGWGEIPELDNRQQSRDIILTGYVQNGELASFYSGASCLVYASLYEGFGQPILEAMACGCPVVTSNLSSMPEVAGKAAVLVDPFSVESIADGIKKALREKDRLIDLGYRQKSQFSWEKTARETLRVYEQISQKT